MRNGARGGTFGLGVVVLSGLAGCGTWADKLGLCEDDCAWTRDEWARIRDLANVTATPPPRDLSNEYLPGDDVWLAVHALDAADPAPAFDLPPIVELGWKLYFDPQLSGPARFIDTVNRDTVTSRATAPGCSMNVACATCHDPAHAGGDVTSVPRRVSQGAGRYDVNGQQTLNAARYPLLYWNGRADTLWAQAAQVIESAVSMNGDRLRTARVLATSYAAEYAALFPDPLPSEAELASAACFNASATDGGITDGTLKGAITRVHVNAAKAIAAYEWMLSSDRSPFDLFVTEGPGSTQLSPSEQRGLKIFVGRGSCYDCHRTPMFSDGKFHDVGVPQVGESVPTVAECVPSLPSRPIHGCAKPPSCDCAKDPSTCLPLGASTGRKKLDSAMSANGFWRGSTYSDDVSSVVDLSKFPARSGAWRTPSLRDVALTAPYMHDGLYDTLGDVVWHYDQGGATTRDHAGTCDPTTGEACPEIGPLGLSDQDRADLVAFLGSLTGQARPTALLIPPPPDPGLPPKFVAACPTDTPPAGINP